MVSGGGLLVGAGLLLTPSSGLAGVVIGCGILGFVIGWLAYLVRHQRVQTSLALADRRTRDGDIDGARALLSPLLSAFPQFPSIQRASGLLLYVSGDPLSASSLLESAMARLGPDPQLVTTLVASYAALNKGGDARRAAVLVDPDVRLALAWSELVALGGNRETGSRIVSELVHDSAVREDPARSAMLGALIAIAAARAGDRSRVTSALAETQPLAGALSTSDRAFISYLGGVALREIGDTEGARLTFTRAMETADGSIGAALARRERSHL